jgi:peptidylprolyl isomerase
MSKVAKKGDAVRVHYVGMFKDHTVFDSSIDGEPIAFTVGAGQMIKGFDEAVVGLEEGGKKTVVIPAVDAYGAIDQALISVVPLEDLPMKLKPEVGMMLEIRDEGDENAQVVRVTQVTDTTVTFDANHPMAGKELTFDIELVSVGG